MPVDAVEQLRALNARLKRNDEVKALALKLARKAFSSWRGRKVHISRGECVLYNLHWSDGCRNQYMGINITTEALAPINPSAPGLWDEKLENQTVEVPQGVAIVVLHSEGSTQFVSVHFNEADARVEEPK